MKLTIIETKNEVKMGCLLKKFFFSTLDKPLLPICDFTILLLLPILILLIFSSTKETSDF